MGVAHAKGGVEPIAFGIAQVGLEGNNPVRLDGVDDNIAARKIGVDLNGRALLADGVNRRKYEREGRERDYSKEIVQFHERRIL